MFDYGVSSDETNKVGVSYILMEQTPGETWHPVDRTLGLMRG
jgi:hypothetical protein